MAESAARQQQSEMVQEHDEKKLKYLDFVQVAVIYIAARLSTLYECAKENAGPLKPGVQTVEGTVVTVIGPVFEKLQDVPFELLKFVDRKAEESLCEIEKHVPSLAKQVSNHALAVACEVQRAGVVEAAKNVTKTVYCKYEPAARELCGKHEPVVRQYAVSAWRSLNRLPLFPQVAQIAVPTAAYWAEKYNQAVCCGAERGFTVSSYMPLIPTESIAKVFDEGVSGPRFSTN